MRKTSSKIYGVGLGVGDPEDMTLKAIRLIKKSDVLAFPKEDLDTCRAYQIARQVIPEVEHKDTLALSFAMTRDEAIRARSHQAAYEAIRELVLQGKTVAFLTIGDPALYSTFAYISDLAQKDGIEVGTASAISSITACANRLGISLCDGNEQLHVIPRVEDLEEALDLPGTKVLMKCGKHMPHIKEELRTRPGVAVFAVAECGTPDELCYRSLEELPNDGGYLLTVIIKENK